MKLTRLRLIGFKSFVEPTDFEIQPGLTGGVGPNGCGKSNLVEAVRWVMGEASYKAKRASEMDDVIFSGNTGRPARNHAEVAVSIDNSARKAPAAFNDSETLEVSRRIMREQGSTFRVNGREVRARDVAMLFADASTGSRSPALVHQGRIGEIIQARPDQRRRVLEEAAGISGPHAPRRTAEQTIANTRQTEVAAGLPALREAEARAAAALQRLIIARETLEREEARAKERIEELDRRLEQCAADLERERRLAADAEAALHRLDLEETALTAEAHASAERLTGVNTRVAQADAALSASEKSFAELTGALADVAARRNQLQTALADHEQRSARLEAELANIEAGLIATGSGEPDLTALGEALAAAQATLAAAEAAARGAEVAHTQARTEIDAAREPLATAERGVQRLETEAKTIGKLFAVESKHLWPPVADSLLVDNGFEKALGAVLGDDLEPPRADWAPRHGAGATVDPSDPQLPDGVTALAQYVKAPPQLARRLAQIGVVDRAAGARLAGVVEPGQRLVSREGDYWRWDGFAAGAHAPTGAARRLAERGRLQAIEGELDAARADVAAKRQTLELAEAAVTAAAEAEVQARMQWRDAQRLTDNAREEHTAAEREIARNAARISALKEARVRISDGCDEA